MGSSLLSGTFQHTSSQRYSLLPGGRKEAEECESERGVCPPVCEGGKASLGNAVRGQPLPSHPHFCPKTFTVSEYAWRGSLSSTHIPTSSFVSLRGSVCFCVSVYKRP